MKQTEITDKTRDLAAFIALALEAIASTIDTSVEAWEKRGTGSRPTGSAWSGSGLAGWVQR